MYNTLRTQIATAEVSTEMYEHAGRLVCIASFSRSWWPQQGPSKRLKTEDIPVGSYKDPGEFQRRVHEDAVALAHFVRAF